MLNSTTAEASQGNTIEVSAQTIDKLERNWKRQWRTEPSDKQLQALIDNYIREEVLYREALALGLDQEDIIIRRRLVQEMEFLSRNMASQVEPTTAKLQAHLEEHPDAYRVPTRIAFTHIYFSEDRRRTEAENDAAEVLATLKTTANPPQKTSNLGDPFMLQFQYPLKSQAEIGRLFGKGFAQALFDLQPGGWQGPIESSYGFHLVKIQKRVESYLPELAEVQKQVLQDWLQARRQDAEKSSYQKLREHYNIKIDQNALAARAV
ncbi:peptidyl-prolyl cis-trans isomerase [Moorena producens]|uniref:peptidylprolyl isomerase n=1 Tax=Moorena producens TaxID=1155739 RepID=UPI0011EA61A6|nr:peptidylprolyl isomerase [Moorena producens]